jgi:hypothetical protein
MRAWPRISLARRESLSESAEAIEDALRDPRHARRGFCVWRSYLGFAQAKQG